MSKPQDNEGGYSGGNKERKNILLHFSSVEIFM
jgi:hypothetical protein